MNRAELVALLEERGVDPANVAFYGYDESGYLIFDDYGSSLFDGAPLTTFVPWGRK